MEREGETAVSREAAAHLVCVVCVLMCVTYPPLYCGRPRKMIQNPSIKISLSFGDGN